MVYDDRSTLRGPARSLPGIPLLPPCPARLGFDQGGLSSAHRERVRGVGNIGGRNGQQRVSAHHVWRSYRGLGLWKEGGAGKEYRGIAVGEVKEGGRMNGGGKVEEY